MPTPKNSKTAYNYLPLHIEQLTPKAHTLLTTNQLVDSINKQVLFSFNPWFSHVRYIPFPFKKPCPQGLSLETFPWACSTPPKLHLIHHTPATVQEFQWPHFFKAWPCVWTRSFPVCAVTHLDLKWEVVDFELEHHFRPCSSGWIHGTQGECGPHWEVVACMLRDPPLQWLERAQNISEIIFETHGNR